ncbi:MFS transporter [Siculibacillus lacustris]|uniref:MFS transporter n=1 Tax=Siculibacillus lacustris TaxID=1549641 RepID=A0A4Q9VW30_9HYPH|nr:MFS transporter [Siculibacillus lacustris]TBW40070.1 MFS transporter [Siculibacillus lacustris]
MTASGTERNCTTSAGLAGWVLFDWAMQPYFTLVTTFVFAPYFATRLAGEPVAGQAWWGYATAAAGLVIAVLSPVLGALADASGRHKPWIAGFGAMMMVGACLLWFARPGHPGAVPLALGAFAVGTIGAEFATVFNNAMMPRLVSADRLGRLSGTGWAVGYVGGLVSLILVLGFVVTDAATGSTLAGLTPPFGWALHADAGARATGPIAAAWFALFVLPMFLFTPDSHQHPRTSEAIGAGLAGFAETVRDLRAIPGLGRFLIANMVYTDGLVALFAFGGIYGAGMFGWSAIELGLFGVLATVTGTIGAFAGGRLDDRFGSRAVIVAALAGLILTLGVILSTDPHHVAFVVPIAGRAAGDVSLYAGLGDKIFLIAGTIVGLLAGPLQASSRTQLARLVPAASSGRFFGLFALSGKLTSFLGPLAVGIVTHWCGDQRAGAAVLLGFLGVGMALAATVASPPVPVSDGSAASR